MLVQEKNASIPFIVAKNSRNHVIEDDEDEDNEGEK